MEYKVGELFYDALQGLCCVTHLDPVSIDLFCRPSLPSAFGDDSYSIGKYVKLLDNREYMLYSKSRHREATDEDVVEYLTNLMLNFPVSQTTTVTLYKGCDLVYLNDEYETIAIARKDIAGIIEILNRELNF